MGPAHASLFKKKSEIVEELRANNADELADVTPMQQEVMDTATISKCQRHIDQLYGGQLVKHETEVQVEQRIKWNMGRRIQCWLLSRVIWRGRGTKAARKKLVVRAVASYIRNKGRAWTELPALDYTYPMDREKDICGEWEGSVSLLFDRSATQHLERLVQHEQSVCNKGMPLFPSPFLFLYLPCSSASADVCFLPLSAQGKHSKCWLN